MLKNFKIFVLTVFFVIMTKTILFAYEEYENKLAYKIHNNVSIEVISSVNSIYKENNLYLGLYFKLDPGWKIYWKYPGKAGYPPNIDWSKSKNIKDLEILWPKPEKFKILGMESVGYSKEVILPIKLILENNNEELIVNFDVDYLTCKKICIPFNDNLKLNIPIGDGKISKYGKIINEYIDKSNYSNYSNYSNFLNPDSILFFLFIAFIGGVILNFMPCVFPVLSLKIYNVLTQQQKKINNKTIKRNFLATIL